MDDNDVSSASPRTPRSVSQPRHSSLTRTQNTIPIPAPPTPLRPAAAPRAVSKSTSRRTPLPASCPSPARGSTSGAVCLRPRILEGHGHGRGGRDRGRLGPACHTAWERGGDACDTHRPAHADARDNEGVRRRAVPAAPHAKSAGRRIYDHGLGLDGQETLARAWGRGGRIHRSPTFSCNSHSWRRSRRFGCGKCTSSSRRWAWACCSACGCQLAQEDTFRCPRRTAIPNSSLNSPATVSGMR